MDTDTETAADGTGMYRDDSNNLHDLDQQRIKAEGEVNGAMDTDTDTSKQSTSQENIEIFYACIVCNLVFLEVSKVLEHIMKAHRGGVLCLKCKYVMKSNHLLKEHEKTCDNERPFFLEFIKCKICFGLCQQSETNDDGVCENCVSLETFQHETHNSIASPDNMSPAREAEEVQPIEFRDSDSTNNEYIDINTFLNFKSKVPSNMNSNEDSNERDCNAFNKTINSEVKTVDDESNESIIVISESNNVYNPSDEPSNSLKNSTTNDQETAEPDVLPALKEVDDPLGSEKSSNIGVTGEHFEYVDCCTENIKTEIYSDEDEQYPINTSQIDINSTDEVIPSCVQNLESKNTCASPINITDTKNDSSKKYCKFFCYCKNCTKIFVINKELFNNICPECKTELSEAKEIQLQEANNVSENRSLVVESNEKSSGDELNGHISIKQDDIEISENKIQIEEEMSEIDNSDVRETQTNCDLDLQVYEESNSEMRCFNFSHSICDQKTYRKKRYKAKAKKKPKPVKQTKAKKIENVEPLSPLEKVLKSIAKIINAKDQPGLFNWVPVYIYCISCNKDYPQRDFVSTHMKNFDDNKECKCTMCCRDVSNMTAVEHAKHYHFHLIGTNIKKLKICTICKYKFLSGINFNFHMKYKHSASESSDNINLQKETTPCIEAKSNNVSEASSNDASTSDDKFLSIVGDIKVYLFNLPFDTFVHCVTCSKEYQVDSYLDEHFRQCVNSSNYNCNLCTKYDHQDNELSLIQHICQHFTSMRHIFKCNLCNYYYLTLENHKTHVENMHVLESSSDLESIVTAIPVPSDQNETMKEDVNEILNQQGEVPKTDHNLQFIEKKLVKDKRCKYLFNAYTIMIYCDVCSKDLTREEYFTTHIEKLLDSNHGRCTLCGKIVGLISHKDYLQHLRMHFVYKYVPKTFKCNICNLAFYTSYNYRIHVKNSHQVRVESNEDTEKEAPTKNLKIPNDNEALVCHDIVKCQSIQEEIVQYLRKILIFVSPQDIYIYCVSCSRDIYFEDYFGSHVYYCMIQNKFACSLCKSHARETNILKMLAVLYKHVMSNLNCVWQCRECDKIYLSTMNHNEHATLKHKYCSNSAAPSDPSYHVPPLKINLPELTQSGAKNIYIEKKEKQVASKHKDTVCKIKTVPITKKLPRKRKRTPTSKMQVLLEEESETMEKANPKIQKTETVANFNKELEHTNNPSEQTH